MNNQRGLTWKRSSRCDSSACVEVAFSGQEAAIRDSKVADGPVLWFPADQWKSFVDGVAAGEFDLTGKA